MAKFHIIPLLIAIQGHLATVLRTQQLGEVQCRRKTVFYGSDLSAFFQRPPQFEIEREKIPTWSHMGI
jgi:hypothetical protein